MRHVIWTTLLLLLASSVGAQSLAEVARKEKERRDKVQAPEDRTYTEADLRTGQGPMTQVTGSSSTAENEAEEETSSAESGEAEPEDAVAEEEDDPTQTEAYWRGRLDPLDARIREMEARLQQPEYTQNQSGGSARAALERQIEQARAARQAIVDEGRRAGVPPGWLR